MGAERKRGKLAEFNRLLRGATDTSFVVQHGDTSILPTVRYVITLDSDTQLPMEAGRRLVGTLSHPLNRPRFDARRQRVTEGYGVLQPRISVSVVSANRTMFSRVFSGHVGVDPYTTAVSDLYQDMFHEGSYVGKGIYDVDAFESALAGRVPENTLLSHDLFEGFYARAGLVTDIDLVDDYPAQLPRLLRAAAPVGARRLADCPVAVADGSRRGRQDRRQHAAGHLALEDPRQPAAQPHSAVARAAARRRLDGPARIASALDDARRARAGVSRLHSARALDRQPRARRAAAGAPAGRRRHDGHEPAAGGLLDRHPGAPERRDARRHRARDVPDARHATAAARVDDGGSGRERARDGVERGEADVAGAGRRAGDRRGGCGRRARTASARQSHPHPVVHLAGARLRLRAAAGAPRDDSRAERAGAFARSRAAHLAVLRGTGRSRRSLARARQLPGRSSGRHRPPDVTDQHRPAASLDAGGVRPRLSQLRGRPRSARADVRHAPAHAAVSRTLLQLVRHADAGPPRAGVHLHRRQRQPRRLPSHAAGRTDFARRQQTRHRRKRARGSRGCDQPFRGRDRRTPARSRDERTEAGARQPAHAAGATAGRPLSSGSACSHSSTNACRRSASCSTTSSINSRSRSWAARRPKHCRRRSRRPRRGSNVRRPSSPRGSSSSIGSQAG